MSKVKTLVQQTTRVRGKRQPALSGACREGGLMVRREAPGQGAQVKQYPPTVNTGERSKLDAHSNMLRVEKYEQDSDLIKNYQSPASAPIQLCMRDGKIVMQMVRIPAQSECCTIDTIRITMNEQTIFNKVGGSMICDDDIARGFSKCIEEIFGFGITRQYEKGRDFFSFAWELGDNYGHFAMGGVRQRDAVLIAINGQGCLAAKPGWELRLYQFITSADCISPRITRVDLAHDDFEGAQFSVHDFDRVWETGGFDRFGNRPEPHNYGPWKNNDPQGKGLTFYAGTKSSSQLFRGYEKGKQLGSPFSPWVRAEVQFSNRDKIIPFEILIDPSGYFVAAYPILQQYSPQKTGKRTTTTKKMAEAGIEHFTKYTKIGYGKFIRIARQLYGDSAFLDMVQSDTDDWPSRLRIPNYEFSPTPIHKQQMPESCVPFAVTASDYGYPDDTSSTYSHYIPQ